MWLMAGHSFSIILGISCAFGLPAVLLLLRSWWTYRRRKSRSNLPAALWTGIIVMTMYLGSLPNLVFKWSSAYAFGWPLFGVLIALAGVGLSFAAPLKQRLSLLAANALLIPLVILSVIPPN